MKARLCLMVALVLIAGTLFNVSFKPVAAATATQASGCSIKSENGTELVINDTYLSTAFFYVYCGHHQEDHKLAEQAAFQLDTASLTILEQGKGSVKVKAKKAGYFNVRAIMPDKSMVTLFLSVKTKEQYDKDRTFLSIDEALKLFRMKMNDVNGEYGYDFMYEDGSYVFKNMTRGEFLGESEIFRIDPVSGNVYGYLDDLYVDNLLIDKHDPPFTVEQCVQLLKQRFLKNVDAKHTVEATGNYDKGRIEIGVFSLIKSMETGKMAANYGSSYTTYLVDPATGDVFNGSPSFMYKGTIATTKIERSKNKEIYVNDMLQDYYRKLSLAVNDDYYNFLYEILKPGSAIDKQQRQFAKKMYAAGTKEQFGKAYTVDRTEKVSSKVMKIYVTEQTAVTPKNGKARIVKEKWMYQVEKETYVWRFTNMSRW
ncbi:TcaA NTF2-like domain-containing protein [Paenibacillus sp. MMS18-CY102]|uniref:TcaA NTF2-like domain-containing protein n=1 Tax=Paenibacillus sp. MMS18-CY102 TaxID=2682849 RepID=UPI00136540EC|nr:hypothetical protein [Paenibacillus sp. MMS18-CY102]MWC29744.1 hypothetical protein [Paenibacillus sp. MMS18-CY102]